MQTFNSIILKEIPNISNFENKEEYYDRYWGIVLDYPLIFLPNNKLIFWGLEITVLKNEYNLLKSIIMLNTNNRNNNGFTEDEIIKTVDYRISNCRNNKAKAIQRFITTSKARIKKQLKKALVEACLNKIRMTKFNPFKVGEIKDKWIKSEELDIEIEKLKNNETLIIKSNLNLVKIFTHMLNLTSVYDKYYSSFVFTNAFENLIYYPKGQKHKSEHRLYKTSFIFCNEKFQRNNKTNPRKRCKDKLFQYAKTTMTKFNFDNFVNYSQYKVKDKNY